MRQRLDQVWAESSRLLEAGERDRWKEYQRATADELFGYYLEHPTTEMGEKTLIGAFMMWGNVGAAEAVDAAIPRIDPGLDAWADLIRSTTNAYSNAGRSLEERRQFLERMRDGLTAPDARVWVRLELAEICSYFDEKEKARELLEKAIEIDADPWFMERAKGDLYEMDHLQVGQPAPEFAVVDMQGLEWKLAGLRGKVVLLEFWSTTCGPCLPEIPNLQKLDREFDDEMLVILGVSMDEDRSVLVSFLERQEMTWPQICDGSGRDGALAKSYNVDGIPSTYVIDREGRIAIKNIRGEKLIEAVQRLVAESETES